MNNQSKEEKAYIEYVGVKSERIKAVDYLNEHGALTIEDRTAQEALIKELFTKESEALMACELAYYESRASNYTKEPKASRAWNTATYES